MREGPTRNGAGHGDAWKEERKGKGGQKKSRPSLTSNMSAYRCAERKALKLSDCSNINAFAHAREVVAPHGAGLANLVFSPAGTRVVEFFHRAYVNPCFARLAELKNLDYHPVIPAGPDAISHEPRGNRLDLFADVPAILAALRKN